jgi:hypothetical protein
MTIWDEGVRRAQEEFCLERSPDGVTGYEILHSVRERLRTGFYPAQIVEFTFQKGWRPNEITLSDAYCFMHVWSDYLTGDLCLFAIPVGSVPRSDSALEENTKALANLYDFQTFVHNAPKDDDGWLGWNDKIGCQKVVLENGIEKRSKIWLQPSRVPLEIGSTSAARTFGHLETERGLARWPYGSKQILVGVKLRYEDLL